MRVLRLLSQARAEQQHALTLESMSSKLVMDPLQIEPILDKLGNLDWVVRLDEPGSARFALICEPATTLAAPLLVALLLDPIAELQGFWHRVGFDRMSLQALLQS